MVLNMRSADATRRRALLGGGKFGSIFGADGARGGSAGGWRGVYTAYGGGEVIVGSGLGLGLGGTGLGGALGVRLRGGNGGDSVDAVI